MLLTSFQAERKDNVVRLAILFINAFLYNKMANSRGGKWWGTAVAHRDYYFKLHYWKNPSIAARRGMRRRGGEN